MDGASRTCSARGPTTRSSSMEIDTDGTAQLRFGDGTNGKEPGRRVMTFSAVYRVGQRSRRQRRRQLPDQLVCAVAARGDHRSCTNPLPATGGVDPETNAQIRRRAPQAFLTQERAVTMQDYVERRRAEFADRGRCRADCAGQGAGTPSSLPPSRKPTRR